MLSRSTQSIFSRHHDLQLLERIDLDFDFGHVSGSGPRRLMAAVMPPAATI